MSIFTDFMSPFHKSVIDVTQVPTYRPFSSTPNLQEAIWLAEVRKDGLKLRVVACQTDGICIAAVMENGLALKYVREQTPEVCMVAIRQTGTALQHVRDKTDALCMEAVRKDGWALLHVREQTEEICITALRTDFSCFKFVTIESVSLYWEICKLPNVDWDLLRKNPYYRSLEDSQIHLGRDVMSSGKVSW